MDRFVIGGALLAAFVLAAGAGFGGLRACAMESPTFVRQGAPAGPVELGDGAPLPPQVYPVTRIALRDVVGVVRVLPEDRADVEVSATGGAGLPALERRLDGDRVVIDGKLGRRIRSCSDEAGGKVEIAGVGVVTPQQTPEIVIRTPRDVVVETSGALLVDVGPSASVAWSDSSCGRLRFEAISGAANLSISGSSDLEISSSGSLEVNASGNSEVAIGDVADAARLTIAGSGDMKLGAVGGDLSVSIAGSGDIDVGAATRAVDVQIAGSGDVAIAGGRPQRITASIAGSGGVEVTGPVGDAEVNIFGSGDFRVGAVEGRLQQSVLGSGEVHVGR